MTAPIERIHVYKDWSGRQVVTIQRRRPPDARRAPHTYYPSPLRLSQLCDAINRWGGWQGRPRVYPDGWSVGPLAPKEPQPHSAYAEAMRLVAQPTRKELDA